MFVMNVLENTLEREHILTHDRAGGLSRNVRHDLHCSLAGVFLLHDDGQAGVS